MTSPLVETNIRDRGFLDTLKPHVEVIDNIDGLDLYCYTTTNKEAEQQEGSADEEDIGYNNIRGLIFKGDKVVMNSFPKPVEIDLVSGGNDIEQMKDKLNDVGIDNCTWYDSYEGASIRLFHTNSRWYMSTHRKINAFQSRWSCRYSYGTLFKHAIKHLSDTDPVFKKALDTSSKDSVLDKFYDTLDKNKEYVFLLRNINENRIVCHAPENPSVLYVGSFSRDDSSGAVDHSYTLIKTSTSYKFKTVDEVLTYVETIDPKQTQGVIVFLPDNTQYKIYNTEYKNMSNVRGNESSVLFRFLQVRLNTDYNNSLRVMYPELIESFNMYEEFLSVITDNIHSAYMKRYVHKDFVSLPPNEFRVMRVAHMWHVEDRDSRRVTKDVIYEILNEQYPTSLNKMIKRIKYDSPPPTVNVVDFRSNYDKYDDESPTDNRVSS